MKLSIITPTYERSRQLQAAYFLLKNQSYSNWEWLIYDTSLHALSFDDPRIIYLHEEAVVSVGEKRNRLIERASGNCIVHFDDDDYYGPSYLQRLIPYLENDLFFKRHGWFSLHRGSGQFFYWDAEEFSRMRYLISPLFGSTIKEIEFGKTNIESLAHAAKKGFGFSMAYHKELWQKVHFEDVDFAEDSHFFEALKKKGVKMRTALEKNGELLHIIHDHNLSSEYPQYHIPDFLIRQLMPLLPVYLEMAYEQI